MTQSEKYDVEARAFEIMTGMMAPGKDSPAAAGPTDMAIREETWKDWRDFHDRIIRAMLKAFDEYNS